MAVLPPDSAEALPMPYAQLMTDPDSPIKDFYPTDGMPELLKSLE